MPDLILHKRSGTASAVPAAADLSLGELAINTADGRLFLKKGDGTVVDVTSIGGIQDLTDALAGKEPAIATGTVAQYVAGDKSLRGFGDNVRAQALTGLATPTNVAIAAADTILAAFAKLQGQVTARMTNPMTTAGDMIRGGTSGAPERVAAGTNGHVWTMVSGVPVWAAPSGGADAKQLCTAWVNFNGTGTVAIRDSYNVSSITDIGVGIYEVNFTTSMNNPNYVAIATAGTENSGQNARISAGSWSGGISTPWRTNSFRVGVFVLDTLTDLLQVNVAFFGGK